LQFCTVWLWGCLGSGGVSGVAMPRSPAAAAPAPATASAAAAPAPAAASAAALCCASAAIGSSKPGRQVPGAGPSRTRPANEDRSVVVEADNLFGVFDGHGGAGASEYVASRIASVVSRRFPAASRGGGEPPQALAESFLEVDRKLYEAVQAQAPRRPRPNTAPRCTTCRWWREVPCGCTGVRIPANEGSTGSVVVITPRHVFSASIGDSEALLITEAVEEEDGSEESRRAPPSGWTDVHHQARKELGASRQRLTTEQKKRKEESAARSLETDRRAFEEKRARAAAAGHIGDSASEPRAAAAAGPPSLAAPPALCPPAAAPGESGSTLALAAAPPMCPTCRHPHEQGVACEVCGHVGKAKKRLKASQWDAAAPAPKVRHTPPSNHAGPSVRSTATALA